MSKEQKLYDTLKRIATGYQTTKQLRKDSQGEWGLDYEEALEMAYENIQQDAKSAIKGMKRPL